jgi:lysophospholipase L1-like esterase
VVVVRRRVVFVVVVVETIFIIIIILVDDAIVVAVISSLFLLLSSDERGKRNFFVKKSVFHVCVLLFFFFAERRQTDGRKRTREKEIPTTTTTTQKEKKKKKKMTTTTRTTTTSMLFSLTRSTVSSVMTLLAAGLTVTFSQAMFLHYSYEPIEEEPTRGTSFKGLARCGFVEEDEEVKEEEEQNESTFVSATKMMLSRTKRTTTTTKERRGKSKERKRVVIVGDSLATGVGCTTNTPALARIVAERLAELLSVEIEWIAVGKKGAALSDISSCVLPELRESNNSRRSVSNSNDSGGSSRSRSSNSSGHDSVENEVEEKEEDKNAQNEFFLQQQQFQQQQQQQASSSCARKADAVIILCGINDVKTCFLHGKIFFRENFENELENVIKEIKNVVGSDALVVLPGNPLHIAPLFPNPLREVILKLNDCWDDKKEKVANKLGKRKALFINSPTLQALRDAVRMHGGDSGDGIREGEFTARDGVHPNDMGYKAWANIIAAEVAKVLKDNEVQ